MSITSKIVVKGDAKSLQKLFLAETKNSRNERASFKTKATKEGFEISINASDSTAFRAVTNSISKLLTIYEKTKEMVENEDTK